MVDLAALFGTRYPLIQAPMAGVQGSALAIAVGQVGALGSLPGPAPVVVAGDFNMTWDHTRFRALRSLGYVDSTEGGGDGPVPTWPHGRRLPGGLTAPPVIGIDHVLARGAARIGDTSTVEVAGTDHLGLRARVALPAGRDAPGGR